MVETAYQGVLMGILATAGQDLCAAVLSRVFRLPTGDLALVGRWLGHLPKGVLNHHSISESAVIPHERLVGWLAHYLLGIAFGVTYLSIILFLLHRDPTIASAVIFGLASLIMPWLIVQPSMGAGLFASRAPKPGLARSVTLTLHVAFGVSLYATWLLIQWHATP
jgi:hypothetical protein